MGAVRETLMSNKVLSLLLPDIVIDCALRKPINGYSSQQHLAQLSYNKRSGFCWPYDVHAQFERQAAAKEIR